MAILTYVIDHFGDISAAILALIALAEIVVRLTPTRTDDGFVQKIGSIIKKVLDAVRVPNIKKK